MVAEGDKVAVLWTLQGTHTGSGYTDECAGCDPNRKKSKFERYGLISSTIPTCNTERLFYLVAFT
jgi:hypothetical protein